LIKKPELEIVTPNLSIAYADTSFIGTLEYPQGFKHFLTNPINQNLIEANVRQTSD